MYPVEFEPTISAGERLQAYALNRAATGPGDFDTYLTQSLTLGTKLQTQELPDRSVCRFVQISTNKSGAHNWQQRTLSVCSYSPYNLVMYHGSSWQTKVIA
jgi:hypothetical protein